MFSHFLVKMGGRQGEEGRWRGWGKRQGSGDNEVVSGVLEVSKDCCGIKDSLKYDMVYYIRSTVSFLLHGPSNRCVACTCMMWCTEHQCHACVVLPRE